MWNINGEQECNSIVLRLDINNIASIEILLMQIKLEVITELGDVL